MVVLCQLIPGHCLLSLASDTSYFSSGHCTSKLAKYDYSKSQLFIFMCFYARTVWTEKPTQSLIVPYQLLIADNKWIFFASGVSVETETSSDTSVIFSTKEGDCSEALELTITEVNFETLFTQQDSKKHYIYVTNMVSDEKETQLRAT